MDELKCLLVFGVFIAGMVDKGLNSLAVFIFLTICAGNVTFGQATLLHFASGPVQITGSIQIARLAALAGLLKFTAGLAVGAAAADFLCALHWEGLPSEP